MLACERIGDSGRVQLDLGRALPVGRCSRLVLAPLSLAELQLVVKQQLGRSLPHRTLVRIARTAGGNPFFALELARSLADDASTAAALPLPENLRQLVDGRIAGLPRRTREVLLVAAAVGSPTVELVASATTGSGGDSARALERAVSAGVITLDGPRIRFAHPLFATGVYSSALPSECRLAHRRLVPLVADVEEQARHRALGAQAPDESLASALEAAAEHARRRGAPEIAADLAEHARVLTPPGRTAEYRRRSIQAAEYHFHAGELRRAREMLEAVLNEASEGLERADALRLLGEIHYHEDSYDKAIAVLSEALEHVGQAGAAVGHRTQPCRRDEHRPS
jgi:tetratricopeptide (TPR) repeat protein